jgi:hypothetical protein
VLPGPLEPPPPTSPPGSGSGTIKVPRPAPPIADVGGSPVSRAGQGKSSVSSPTAPRPQVAPGSPLDPLLIADQVITQAASQVAAVVRPAAAAAVATTFGFPLTLMLAVLVFLLVQRYVDRRDPKLRAAPRSTAEGLLEFKDEERL